MIPMLESSNHLFQLARRGQRLTHIADAVFVTAAIVFLSLLLQMLLQSGLAAVGVPSFVARVVQLIGGFALHILFVATWLLLYEKRSLWTVGLERESALSKYLRGIALGLVMYSTVVGSLAIFGYVQVEVDSTIPTGLVALPGVILIYLVWTIQGPAEEVLYRGWLLPTLGARYGPWIGLIVSSLLFTTAHGLNAGISLLALLNLFLFAIFATFYSLAEESLWGIAGWHAAWNWAQGNLYGLQVSGYEMGGTLLNLEVLEPDWISGGSFGPEGGILVTVSMVIGIAVLITRGIG